MKITSLAHREFAELRFSMRNDKLSALFADSTASIPGSRAFARLHTVSLSLASTRVSGDAAIFVNLVLPELRPDGIFAGIRTAVELAHVFARAADLPLRLIPLGNSPKRKARAAIEEYVRAEFGHLRGIEIVNSFGLPALTVNPEDHWIATHWTTAHALDVAARVDVLRRDRVTYLVQDYEPGFDPWGTTFALARTTYHAGFRLVVNSTPLQRYLADVEQVIVDDQLVFAPSLDLARLEAAAAHRPAAAAGRHAKVFFYARPSKPRNLYPIGVAALLIAAEELERRGLSTDFVSGGEPHADVQLTRTSRLVSLGKLPWDTYFTELGGTDVVLSLQHSPHPSHPPLDAVACGAFAVTNELGGTRRHLHPRLLVAEPDPQALADMIVQAVSASLEEGAGAYDPSILAALGRPLPDVVTELVARLGSTRTQEHLRGGTAA